MESYNIWIILFLFILVAAVVYKAVKHVNEESYSAGVFYADPRMTPEFPTYDSLARSNAWNRYDMKSDADPYSPYFPCWVCGGDQNYYHD